MERALPPAIDFMREIWRVNRALERVSKRMEATLGLTAQQRMMIRWIGKFPDITPGRLASQLHVDAGTVSSALARLERRRLLERRRDDDDKRRVSLRLTTQGQTFDRPTHGTVESAVMRLLERASSRDLSATRRILGALTDELDREMGQKPALRSRRNL
jgi:MarR family transcriptional regulator, organic hydroperoxide resistance regulator